MTLPVARRTGPLDWYAPTGRIPRRRWWGYVLALALLGTGAWLLDTWLFPQEVTTRSSAGPDLLFWYLPDQGGPITGIVGIVLLVPNVAAAVTRLHDRDHSAWWLLWLLFPPIGWVVLTVTLAVLGSRPYPNRHGPPPR